jgi:proteasome assembly chaperone (PAC2) family protein
MTDSLNLWEKPAATEKFMLAGWRQWADAGCISSELPQFFIEQIGAGKIGEIRPNGFYLFQLPGTHHFLRPVIKLEDGHRAELTTQKNEFFYAGDADKGTVIFLGDEPHINVEGYADAFFDAVEALGVRRVLAVGGVYGPMPFDRDREVSCTYSLPGMRDELTRYAVRFSNYEGGATIGTYLASRAEERGIEFVVFYGFVPAYDFSELSSELPDVRIEDDHKAWYDILRRVTYMFGLRADLSELAQESDELQTTIAAKIAELMRSSAGAQVREFMDKINAEFEEMSFTPLDAWEEGLDDIFRGLSGES